MRYKTQVRSCKDIELFRVVKKALNHARAAKNVCTKGTGMVCASLGNKLQEKNFTCCETGALARLCGHAKSPTDTATQSTATLQFTAPGGQYPQRWELEDGPSIHGQSAPEYWTCLATSHL